MYNKYINYMIVPISLLVIHKVYLVGSYLFLYLFLFRYMSIWYFFKKMSIEY